MNQIEQDLLELHAKFHKWVRESKHDYSLNVKADDSYSYVQADTQGAFDAFCAGMVAGMEDCERALRDPSAKSDCDGTQDFKLKNISTNGLLHQRFRTVFGVDVLKRSKLQAAADSIIGTNLEILTLELYKTHLMEFLADLTPVPEFRAQGHAHSLYVALNEAQRLYILNKFVAGTFLLTSDIVNEPMFIMAFRNRCLLEENAERVRQICRKDTKGTLTDFILEPGISIPPGESATARTDPNTAASVARTDSEIQALDLYRSHLNEFLTTKFPEPDFRVYGVGDRFYASLDESQKLYILNKFVAGICLETTDLVNERKFIDHFRHKYLFEQNAKRVRQLAGYKTAPSNKQG